MKKEFIKEGNTLLCLFLGWKKDSDFERSGCFYDPSHPSAQPPDDHVYDYWDPAPFAPMMMPEHMDFHKSYDSLFNVVKTLREKVKDNDALAKQLIFLEKYNVGQIIDHLPEFYTIVVGVIRDYNERMRSN
jgi:hypothetical protein